MTFRMNPNTLPFAALSRWVNGVQPNGNCPFPVLADCLPDERNSSLFPRAEVQLRLERKIEFLPADRRAS